MEKYENCQHNAQEQPCEIVRRRKIGIEFFHGKTSSEERFRGTGINKLAYLKLES
jgi:phosphoenolpyruvate carboxylase